MQVNSHSMMHIKAVLNCFQVSYGARINSDQRLAASQRWLHSSAEKICADIHSTPLPVTHWWLNERANQYKEKLPNTSSSVVHLPVWLLNGNKTKDILSPGHTKGILSNSVDIRCRIRCCIRMDNIPFLHTVTEEAAYSNNNLTKTFSIFNSYTLKWILTYVKVTCQQDWILNLLLNGWKGLLCIVCTDWTMKVLMFVFELFFSVCVVLQLCSHACGSRAAVQYHGQWQHHFLSSSWLEPNLKGAFTTTNERIS